MILFRYLINIHPVVGSPVKDYFGCPLKVHLLSRQLARTRLDLNPEMQRVSNGNELSAAFESKVLNVARFPQPIWALFILKALPLRGVTATCTKSPSYLCYWIPTSVLSIQLPKYINVGISVVLGIDAEASFVLGNACSAQFHQGSAGARAVRARHAAELSPCLQDADLRVPRALHWPRWARAGWPKEANVSNLLLLLLRGEETAPQHQELPLHSLGCYCTVSQSKWEPKRNLGPVRGFKLSSYIPVSENYHSKKAAISSLIVKDQHGGADASAQLSLYNDWEGKFQHQKGNLPVPAGLERERQRLTFRQEVSFYRESQKNDEHDLTAVAEHPHCIFVSWLCPGT
ncbi:hypothetical protein EK904_011749 [Melospiza melodia maxima]|nr:hypothetical protein EK904_011749 [Melospiza melodia maxima]